MNNTFDFRRFWNYFKYDLCRARGNFGLSFLILACLPLIGFVLYELFSLAISGQLTEVDLGFKSTIAYCATLIAVIVFPQKQYGQLTDKRSGSDFLMVPASTLEKFVSIVLMTCVVLPIALVTISGALDYLLSLIPIYGENLIVVASGWISKLYEAFAGIVEIDFNTTNFLLLFYASWISSALTFTFGALFFKKGKVAKTFLLLIGISIVVMLLSIVMFSSMDFESFIANSSEDTFITLFNVVINVVNIISIAVPMLACYLVLRNLKH